MVTVSQDNPPDTLPIAICGGGIVGLVLAIGLKGRLGLTAEVFEACDGFAEDVGAGKSNSYFDVSNLPYHCTH